MDALDKEADKLIQMAWAPRTLQTYQVGMDKFHNFRIKMKARNPCGAANAVEMVRFIASLSLERKAPTTIAAYVSAVSNWHKTNRWDDPCDDFLVKKALKGGSKRKSNTTLREPISIILLAKLVKTLHLVCESKYEVSMIKSAFLLAFFGLFRIGEMVADTKVRAQRSVMLLRDIVIKDETLTITVRFSKTDQTGKSSSIVVNGQKGNPLCPVEAVKKFVKRRGTEPGPLFLHYNGSFLSRFQFNKILLMALSIADPKQANIQTHSFRIGGATNAMAKGVPYEKIQEMGRWKSNVAKRYIRSVDVNIASLS